MSNYALDVRTLSGTMAKILLVFLFERRDMVLEDVSRASGVRDVKTVRSALKELAGDGLLAVQRGQHGRETFLPAGALLPFAKSAYYGLPEGGFSPSCTNQKGDFPLPGAVDNGQKTWTEGGFSPTWSEKPGQKGGNPLPETGSIMMIDDINTIDLNHHQSEPEKASDLPAMDLLFEHLPDLFGSELAVDEVPSDCGRRLALAWIVKAYQDKGRLKNPLGLLRARLNAKTPRSLPKSWQERLPAIYLEHIGMLEPQTMELLADDAESEPEDDAWAEITSEFQRSAIGKRLSQAWNDILSELQQEIQRASFDDFVRDTFPVAFAEGGADDLPVLRVAARNTYAVDWLQDRLESTVERMMAGMLNRECVVKFAEVEHGSA